MSCSAFIESENSCSVCFRQRQKPWKVRRIVRSLFVAERHGPLPGGASGGVYLPKRAVNDDFYRAGLFWHGICSIIFVIDIPHASEVEQM